MKFYRLALILFAVLLSSCDTRDDYFLDHSEKPEITLLCDNDSTINGKNYITVEIGWGDSIAVDYNFHDIYGVIQNFYVTSVPLINNRKDSYYWASSYDWESSETISDFNQLSNHIVIEIDSIRKKILFVEKTKSANEYYPTNHSNLPPAGKDSLVIESFLSLHTSNILGKEGSSNIILRIKANRAPSVSFSMEMITGESSFHRKIEALATDPDNDRILAYEYCIDGKIFEQESGYEIINPRVLGAGKGAYNGTYITATSLNCVKHVFQETGTHSVSVRCKDAWGCWSPWVTKDFSIE